LFLGSVGNRGLYGVESGSSEEVPYRYTDEQGKERQTLCVTLRLSGEGTLTFCRFGNETEFQLDSDYMCVYRGNILYRPEQKSSDPWIWVSIRLANLPGDFPRSRGYIPIQGDTNVPTRWKPPEIEECILDATAKKRRITRNRKYITVLNIMFYNNYYIINLKFICIRTTSSNMYRK
jgi:hypothetical protein